MQTFSHLFYIYCSSFHQSSDSGSESGIWTKNSTKSKSSDSDNNTGSNGEDDIGSVDFNVQDGSGTQVKLYFIIESLFYSCDVYQSDTGLLTSIWLSNICLVCYFLYDFHIACGTMCFL